MSPDTAETTFDIEAVKAAEGTAPKPAVPAPESETPDAPVKPARPAISPSAETVVDVPAISRRPISATPATPKPPAPAAVAELAINVNLTNHQDDLPVADSPQLIRLLRRSVEISGLCRDADADKEVSFSLVDLETIADVNMQHLQHEGPTDVITFDYRGDDAPATPDEAATLGEVMVCPAMALRQAPEHAQDVATEMVLYLVHGILHLCGHDDVQDAARPAMRQAEQDLLARLREEFDFSQLFGEPTSVEPV
jgi:probable rRNA maturation factor